MTSRLLAEISLLSIAMLGCSSGPTREQAEQSGKNVTDLTLAVLKYEGANRGFPLRALKAKDGKPGLSWRVAILPFLKEEALYKEFHLDEPWDSPHNKALVEKMPTVFRSPLSAAQDGYTNYLGLETPDSAFRPDRGVTQAGVSWDGTMNSILLLEVNDDRAIPWTKPGDFVPDSAHPMVGLGKLHPEGAFLVSMISGDVHLLQTSLDPKIFRALCTTRGSEIVDWDVIKPKPDSK